MSLLRSLLGHVEIQSALTKWYRSREGKFGVVRWPRSVLLGFFYLRRRTLVVGTFQCGELGGGRVERRDDLLNMQLDYQQAVTNFQIIHKGKSVGRGSYVAYAGGEVRVYDCWFTNLVYKS